MADIKKQHPVYGGVTVLQSGSALVQIETEDGNIFWTPASSFIKKKAKPRAKKKVQPVRKVDELVIDALLARETRSEELEPEVFDVEDVVQVDDEEGTGQLCEESITSDEDMAA